MCHQSHETLGTPKTKSTLNQKIVSLLSGFPLIQNSRENNSLSYLSGPSLNCET